VQHDGTTHRCGGAFRFLTVLAVKCGEEHVPLVVDLVGHDPGEFLQRQLVVASTKEIDRLEIRSCCTLR
jgi:hypothetical protein